MKKLHLKFYIVILFSLISLGFLTQSCNDQSIAPTNNPSDKTEAISLPTVQNNSLVFNSRNDFTGLVKKLNAQPYDQLNAFMAKETKGFTSLMQMKDKIRQSKSPIYQSSVNSTKILQLDIADPNLASIVNENGVFQIGEQVFKITNKYTYIFKDRAAFEAYNFTSAKNSSEPNQSYVEPCYDDSNQRNLTQLTQDTYRVDNCGTGGGGGGYDPGDDEDNSYPNQDVIDLDPYADMDIDYASERTEEYRSGGKDGRLRGSTWNQNFGIFSSIGAKTIHERHSWGKWWDRTADRITLDSFARYSYGEKLINPTQLSVALKTKVSAVTKFIPGGITNFIQRTLNLAVGEELSEKIWVAANNAQFTIITQKVQDDRFNYDIYPDEIQEFFSHSKSDAKRIREVYDWSTLVVTYPPSVQTLAVDFELDISRAKHTLEHDGYHLGFITDKRE